MTRPFSSSFLLGVALALGWTSAATSQVVDMAFGQFDEPAGLKEGDRLSDGQTVRMSEGSLLVILYERNVSGRLCQIFEYVHDRRTHRVRWPNGMNLCLGSAQLDDIDDLVAAGRSFVEQVAFDQGQTFVDSSDQARTQDDKGDDVSADDDDKGGGFGGQETRNLGDQKALQAQLRALAKPEINRQPKTPGSGGDSALNTPKGQGNRGAGAANQRAEQACFLRVQGKVAWNGQGDTRWDDRNVRRLCRNASAQAPGEPARCFSAALRGAVDGSAWGWSDAIDLCQGAMRARVRLNCYRELSQTRSRADAIRTCRLRS